MIMRFLQLATTYIDFDGRVDFDDLGYDAECSWTNGSANSSDWGNPGKQYK